MKKQMDQMKELGGGKQDMTMSEEKLPKSILLGAAFLLVVFSLFASFAAIGDSNPKAGVASGVLAAIALALIVVQLLMGFPIEQKIKEDELLQKFYIDHSKDKINEEDTKNPMTNIETSDKEINNNN